MSTGTVFTKDTTIYAKWTKKPKPDPDPAPAPGPTYEYRTLKDGATGGTLTGWFTPNAALVVVQNQLHEKGACTACDEIRAA